MGATGLGSYNGPVDVEVIWPCGQTQYTTAQPGQYNTITMGWPEITPGSVKAYFEWIPGSSIRTWVFEWETTNPSDMSMDMVHFPGGVTMGLDIVNLLYHGSPSVDYDIEMTTAGNYKHLLKWLDRPCDPHPKVNFIIHSKAIDRNYEATGQLTVMSCPITM